VPTLVGSDLSVTVDGQGTVTGDKIDCGDHCTASYGFGVLEHLKASAATGYAFTGWQGGCGTQADCSFPVGPITAVKATFAVKGAALSLSLRSVGSSGHRAKRKVKVALTASAAGALTLRLETTGGRKVAVRKVTVGAGKSSASVAVPKKTKPGRYRIRLTLVAGTQSVKLAHLVRIGR
jgi:hypothetical protein